MRFGAVFILLGIVRFSAVRVSLFQNNTVQCSTVFLLTGAVRYGLPGTFFKNRTVRCSTVRLCIRLTVVFYGAVDHAAYEVVKKSEV